MSWWPFRSPSPRDEYPPELSKTERFDLNDGVFERTEEHACRLPTASDLFNYTKLSRQLLDGDRFKCNVCKKHFEYDDATELWCEL